MVPNMPTDLLPKGLALARRIPGGEWRALALTAFLPRLTQNDRFSVALQALWTGLAESSSKERGSLALMVSPFCDGAFDDEAREVLSRGYDAVVSGMWYWLGILPPPTRQQVRAHYLALVQAVDDESRRARLLETVDALCPSEDADRVPEGEEIWSLLEESLAAGAMDELLSSIENPPQ